MLRIALALTLLIGALPCGHAAGAAAASAADTVSRFHEDLVETMNKAPSLACEARMAKLAPAVDRAFDLRFIAERVLRRHWKDLNDGQRGQFTAALRRSVLTTYVTEFSSPGSVRFSTGTSESLANGDSLVHATLSPAKAAPVTLDYQLKRRGEQWQVVNVIAEGVSDLALRATQYDGLMKEAGFDGLLSRLDSQTQQLRNRCP